MAKLVHNVQKKQHKERAQLLGRLKYGLLEKKKDYRLRANDFNQKKAALKALRQQAAEYNPDEYYHAMIKRKTDADGIEVVEKEHAHLSHDQIKLFKSQDLNYVRTMRLNEASKIRRLKERLNFAAEGKHTVFVDSAEAQASFDSAAHFQTDASMLERRENRLRAAQLERVRPGAMDAASKRAAEREKLRDYRELKDRMERERQLREVEEALERTKELMKSGEKRKMVDPEGRVHYRWTPVRKR